MRINCIVVDDEPLAREGLEGYIAQTSFLTFIKSFDGASPVPDFLQNNNIDLMFLDIEMPEVNGIQLLRSLRTPPKVILTTAYREYAVDGFELGVVDYLLKPIGYERFLKSTTKVLMQGNTDPVKDAIFIKCDGAIVKVRLQDILFAETAKDYVFIYLENGQKHMALFSLKQLEAYLSPNTFHRVHRSFLVNLTKVDKIEGHLLHMHTHKIPISRVSKEWVVRLILGDRLIQRNQTEE